MQPKYINQEHEVREKLNEYNKTIGYDPAIPEVDKIRISEKSVDLLLEGQSPEEGYELFNMYRRSRRWMYSITVKRGSPFIYVEYHIDNHPRVDFSRKSHMLLYGSKDKSFSTWKTIPFAQGIKYFKVDIRSDFPVVSKTIPEE